MKKKGKKASGNLPSTGETGDVLKKKRGWPKGKLRKPKEPVSGWVDISSKGNATRGWRKMEKKNAKKKSKPILSPAELVRRLDDVEFARLRKENESLRYILGRLLVSAALQLKAKGEFITF